MNILQIPANQPAIIDSHILLYACQRASTQCVKLLDRIASGDIYGVITTETLSELANTLMMLEAKDSGFININNSLSDIGKLNGKIRLLNRYENLIKDLLSIGLKLECVTREDFLTAMKLQRQYGLLIHDALFLAAADRLRITSIVSNKENFKNIPGVIVYSPDDLEF